MEVRTSLAQEKVEFEKDQFRVKRGTLRLPKVQSIIVEDEREGED